MVAWLVINQDWILEFPSIQFTYKPWRLFIVGCSILSLVSFITLCILPESPKFVLSQGNQAEAIQILKTIHRWNCGKNAAFVHIYELHDETAPENKQSELKKSMFASIWFQIKPLFMAPHLKTTVLLCILKFIEFAGTNGVYVWIPDMLNRLATNDIDYPGDRIKMCDVVYRYRPNITYTDTDIVFAPEVCFNLLLLLGKNTEILSVQQSCISKFEIATYEQTLLLEIFYTLSFVIQAILINKIGKFPLLCQYRFFFRIFFYEQKIWLKIRLHNYSWSDTTCDNFKHCSHVCWYSKVGSLLLYVRQFEKLFRTTKPKLTFNDFAGYKFWLGRPILFWMLW